MQGFRNEKVTFTRFIAAVAIVIFHFCSDVFPFNAEPISFIFKSAYVGVSYFFTLSGFIMILAYSNCKRIDALGYYKSRFARIAPAYYLALVLCVPLIIEKWAEYSYSGIALNITMLQAWNPSKALSGNSPSWSLSVELLFYFLFPFLFNFVYQSRKFWIIVIVGGLFFLISQVIHNSLINSGVYQNFPLFRHNLIFYFPPMHLNEFLSGNIAGLFYMKYIANKNSANGFWIILSIIAFCIVLKYPTGLSIHNGLLVLVFIPIIILISSDNGLIARIMSLKPLIFLGEISFGIYIFQMPIHEISYAIFKIFDISNYSVLFFSYLAILVLVSGLSFKFIETPLRRRINEISMRPGRLSDF
ncbi:MAG TPA: acyltransferase [Rhodoferax sp.]|nr:acyltransferase [Rhodoferax sp.]